jgi:hypothetical protein
MSIRLLSMSSTPSLQTSLSRSPVPYVVITMARYIGASRAWNRPSTSVPLKMSGSFCSTFGHGIRAITSGRSRVASYKNLIAATCILRVGAPTFFSVVRWSRNCRISRSPISSGGRRW